MVRTIIVFIFILPFVSDHTFDQEYVHIQYEYKIYKLLKCVFTFIMNIALQRIELHIRVVVPLKSFPGLQIALVISLLASNCFSNRQQLFKKNFSIEKLLF